MNACIVAIGTELLTPFRVDTNSLVITERLNSIGCSVTAKTVVGDDVEALGRLLAGAIGSVDVIVCTGGLGPTEDDVTREAVARALNLPLDVDQAIEERIRARFTARGLRMASINRRQALVPRGAEVLENPNGTAPGLWLEHGQTVLVLLPGPPREMTPMLEAVIRDRLSSRAARTALFRRVIKVTGRPESDVDERTQPIYARWRSQPVPVHTTILASLGQIELHLTAEASSRAEADRALDPAVAELHEALGLSVVSVDGRTIEAVVGDLLRAARRTIAIAESCTGGLLTSRLTDVPGSSSYVDRAAVCYSNQSKVQWLAVPEALIAAHGAVSEPVARAMAEGVRASARASVGVGVTGIAGPDGGTPDKPVGTVAIAVATETGSRTHTFRFLGGREHVKDQAATTALNMVRLMLLRG
jgi:nicotinamide-nucleotide amidase